MFLPDSSSSLREVLLFLRSLPRYEVAALCVFLNNNFDAEIPSYASKGEMLEHLSEIKQKTLLKAIEAAYPESDCDEDEDLEEEDEEDEDSIDED